MTNTTFKVEIITSDVDVLLATFNTAKAAMDRTTDRATIFDANYYSDDSDDIETAPTTREPKDVESDEMTDDSDDFDMDDPVVEEEDFSGGSIDFVNELTKAMFEEGSLTIGEIRDMWKYDEPKLREALAALVAMGKVKKTGEKRSTRYELVKV